MTHRAQPAPPTSRVPGGRSRIWPTASIRWRSPFFPESAFLRYPQCLSKLAGDGGSAGRASGGFEAQERCREASVDPRIGSGPRREERLGFGELSSRGEGAGVLTRACTFLTARPPTTHLLNYFTSSRSRPWLGLGLWVLFHVWDTATLEPQEPCNKGGTRIEKKA